MLPIPSLASFSLYAPFWNPLAFAICLLCDAECKSVSHVLWDCPAYAAIRSAFMLELRRELRDRFEHFQSLDESSYILGSEAWEEYSKDFVLSVWVI